MKFFKKNKSILLLLFAALLFRVVISFFGTLHLDQGTFIAWSNILIKDGFKNFYNSWSDYLPGYLYVLWFLGKISLGFLPQVFLYKLPAILSDLAMGLLIYKIVGRSKKWKLIAASIYLFNPAIFANSALWGQVDGFSALTSVLSVYLLPFNYLLSVVSLSIGTLIKPQVAFTFPVIIFLFLKNKRKISEFIIYCLSGLSIFILGFLPFWNHGSFISFVLERLSISLNQYSYSSVNAFNFWGIIGFWKPDNLYFQMLGYAIVILSFTLLAIKLWKKKKAEYYLLAFIFAASFAFFTRMHERHLLPVFAPLAIISIENPLFLFVYLGFSLTYILNLYYSFVWITQDFKQVIPDMLVKFLSLFNVSLTISAFYILWKDLILKWSRLRLLKKKDVQVKFSKVELSKRKIKYILIAILVFAFATRVFNLGSPDHEYFDEVYHAFTAKVILHGDPKAWEWWNTPPQGFAYEWTHPPVAKLGMASGMFVFGENPFGYRIPGAILGVLSVLMVYFVAKELFKDESLGLISAAVFSLDGLPLVMSRIGMNDSYILFFALLAIYFFLKEKDFWSALSFGLALASKWSALWSAPILFLVWLRRKNKFRTKTFIFFLIVPALIYLGSYFDMFLTGHGLSTWWGMQEQMWWYHTGLKATHPYSSSWWTWPFLIRPIYLYTSDEVRGMVSRIYAMGNPIVFWFGFFSVILSFIYTYLERNRNLGLVVFSYLIFFVPWALSPRIMFLYHYLPSVPFLAIATGYVLRRNPKLSYWILGIGLLVFIYFYPHWTGLSVPLWLDKSYYWFPSWR